MMIHSLGSRSPFNNGLRMLGAFHNSDTPAYLRTYMHIRAYMMYACKRTSLHPYNVTYRHACMHAYMYPFIHTHYAYTHMYTYIHTCIQPCIQPYEHPSLHTYIMHAYTHVHILGSREIGRVCLCCASCLLA